MGEVLREFYDYLAVFDGGFEAFAVVQAESNRQKPSWCLVVKIMYFMPASFVLSLCLTKITFFAGFTP